MCNNCFMSGHVLTSVLMQVSARFTGNNQTILHPVSAKHDLKNQGREVKKKPNRGVERLIA